MNKSIFMKRVIQIQLLPTSEQADLLEMTMRRFNEACNWVAERAFERKLANRYALHKLHYYEVRERLGLSSQMACLTFAKVAGAYKRDKSKQVSFRPLASMPYDRHLLRYIGLDKVSLATLAGRIVFPMIMGGYQAEQFSNVKLYAELVRRHDGKWFLMATVEHPDDPMIDPTDFLGVDLGIEHLATDSDGEQYSGEQVEQVRIKCQTHKQQLQSAADQAQNHRARKRIRKKLRRRARQESNFRRTTNHVLSKRIVEKAKDTGRGIVLEDLKGIRDRIRFRTPQRSRMAGWGFDQLRQFIAYKAQAAGVKLMLIDPKHTSQMCSQCGHVERANRSSQADFRCKQCGHTAHADYNAALNIRAKALVSEPIVSAYSVAAG
jgi:IS605 OrfB family transposase